MFTLDGSDSFVRVLSLRVPWAHSYADMRPGKTDRERRENFRNAAANVIGEIPENAQWWAFRITVQKSGRQLDVDNVSKTIIDSFSGSQILRDGSHHTALALYPDDTFDHVRILQVIGNPRHSEDSTHIEIFAFKSA